MHSAPQNVASATSFNVAQYPDFLPHDRMNEIETIKSSEYATATPYPHVVVDDFSTIGFWIKSSANFHQSEIKAGSAMVLPKI